MRTAIKKKMQVGGAAMKNEKKPKRTRIRKTSSVDNAPTNTTIPPKGWSSDKTKPSNPQRYKVGATTSSKMKMGGAKKKMAVGGATAGMSTMGSADTGPGRGKKPKYASSNYRKGGKRKVDKSCSDYRGYH